MDKKIEGNLLVYLILGRIISTFVNLGLLFTLVNRWQKTRIKAILLLVATTINRSIVELIKMGNTLFASGSISSLSDYSAILMGIFGFSSAGMFLLFIDYFENERISTTRVALFIGSLCSYIVGVIILTTLSSSVVVTETYDFLSMVVLLIAPFFLVSVTIIGCYVLQNCKSYTYDKKHRQQLTLMQLSLMFFFLFTSIYITTSNLVVPYLGLTPNQVQLFLVLPQDVSLSIGAVLLWLAYARSTRVAFLQPQRIHKLIVVNYAGLPIFSYSFLDVGHSIDDSLITGGITAVSSLLGESLGVSSGIESISLESIEMMMENYDKFAVILFTERVSSFLKKAVCEFGSNFDTKYSHLVSDGVDISSFVGTETLVEQAFGLEAGK